MSGWGRSAVVALRPCFFGEGEGGRGLGSIRRSRTLATLGDLSLVWT